MEGLKNTVMFVNAIVRLTSVLASMTGQGIEHALETVRIGAEGVFGEGMTFGDRRSGYSSDGGAKMSSDSEGSRPMSKKRARTGNKGSAETALSVCFRDAMEERPPTPVQRSMDRAEVTRMRLPLAHEMKKERRRSARVLPIVLRRKDMWTALLTLLRHYIN